MGKSLYRMELFNLHRPEPADLSQIISSQIYQHIVFRQFFFVSQKFLFQRPVFFRCLSSRFRPGKRKSMQYSVLQPDESLGRSSGDLHISTGKIKHIRGRIDGPQNPVSIQQTSFKRRAETV